MLCTKVRHIALELYSKYFSIFVELSVRRMKIAVIFESSPFDRKGQFNAVHDRIRHLLETGECEIDAYCLHSRDNFITRRIRGNPKAPVRESVTIDGITYRILWYRFSVLDHLMKEKLHGTPALFDRFVRRSASMFKEYDLIAAHSFEGGYMAMTVHSQYGVPFYVTWHGSDIHSHPVRNPYVLATTRRIMESASLNIFVSKALMEVSSMITDAAPKAVLYNGVSERFRKYDAASRNELRRKYGVGPEEKVVAFVGNIYKVKNVEALPGIFHRINEEVEANIQDSGQPWNEVKFWVVGDGKMRSQVEPAIRCAAGSEVVFWGNMPADEMPDMLNCVDVLVLPSRNEGLPLVLLEAIRCGADTVGSDVGGVAEVIGKENTVPFRLSADGKPDYTGETFIDSFALKGVNKLFKPASPVLSDEFDWKRTAHDELSFIKEILK